MLNPMRFSSVCLALACLGCTSKTPAPVVEKEKEIVIPVGALVVLTDDATVYRELEESFGRSLHEPSDTSVPGYAVEVLAVTDTRLEVRTLGPAQPTTCAGRFEFADDYELRFWVDRTDLRQVLVAPVIFAFADGTKLELRPGVPVIDSERGELGIESQSLVVNLMEAELGLAYEPAAVEVSEGAHEGLRSDAVLHYDQRKNRLEAKGLFGTTTDTLDIEGSTEEVLYVFDNACGRFTLRGSLSPRRKSGLYAMKGPKDAIPRMARNFDPEMAARNAGILRDMQEQGGHFLASPYGGAFAVGNDDEDVWGELTGTEIGEAYGIDLKRECTPPRWTIASGVELSWLRGGPAGTVRRAHELPADARELAGRVCFDLHGFDLCVEASKLGRKLDPDCEDTEIGD
jgi:hypothetical protein